MAKTKDKVFDKIKELIALNSAYEVPESDITENADLNEDLGFDNLDHIELAMGCEKAFGLEEGSITDDDWNELTVKSVGDVLRLVKAKIAEQPKANHPNTPKTGALGTPAKAAAC